MTLVEWIAEGQGKLGTFRFSQSRRAPFNTLLDAGLWHEKFGTRWARPGRHRDEFGVRSLDWVQVLDGKQAGHPTQLAVYAERLLDLARAQGALVFDADIAGLSKFVTGIGAAHPIENGFAWHRALGAPYLPGSGVKGLTLAYARDWLDIDMNSLRQIFGVAIGDESRGQAKGKEQDAWSGAVVFLDAVPIASPVLTAQILTPHGKGSGPPDDAGGPNPIGFLAVKSGRFRFALLPARGPADRRLAQCREARDWLKDALKQIGAGAKTKSGYGRFANFADVLVQPAETLVATTL